MCSIDVPLLIAEEDDLSFENTISKPIKEVDRHVSGLGFAW